ncbi:MAG: hypothetical protein UH850_09585 [Paludibacteraceae bacterium]|nr:hypothetical protein [Paludibacteraceae bacterium]
MLFSKLLKAGAAASLVLTCAGVNAQSWTSNSTYGLYVNQLKGTKGNVAIGVAASSSYQGNRLTIKADSAKNGLRIYDYKGNTRLLQGSNGGLTVGGASAAPANGLYVVGASNLRSSLTVAGTSTFSNSATFNSSVTAKSGLIVSSGLAKFDGPVSMNSTMVTTGAATFNSGITVIGASTFAGAVKVTGATTLAGTTTGALTASSLTSNGAAALKTTLTVTGKSTLNGGLAVSGASTFNGSATFNNSFVGKGTSNEFYNGLRVNTTTTIYNSIRFTRENNWELISAYGSKNYDPLAFLASKYNFTYGNVGIGVEDPQAKLHVAGKILCTGEIEVADLNSNSIKVNSLNAKDIQMDMHGAADYVFDENYNLKSLSEVENYVNEHKHLPGMPSAAEMDANGVSVSKMSNLLLEKVEELTLHMIKLEKENEALKARVQELEK